MQNSPGPRGVGEVVRKLREGLGLSVRTFAGRAGFSPSFISQVENSQVSPSIASLERIAGALGITMAEFFNGTSPTTAAVVRADARLELVSEWSRAQIEALGRAGPRHSLEPVMITLAPGGRSGANPHVYSHEVFVIVFGGKVNLTHGGETYVLGRGDSVTLPPDTPHLWTQTGTEPARLVMVSARPQGAGKL